MVTEKSGPDHLTGSVESPDLPEDLGANGAAQARPVGPDHGICHTGNVSRKAASQPEHGVELEVERRGK